MGTATATTRTMTTTTTTKAAAKKECHERQTELYVEAGTEFDKQYGNICETCYANRFFCSLVRSFVCSLCLSYPDIIPAMLSYCCACINYLSWFSINLLVFVFLWRGGRLAKRKKAFAINRGKKFLPWMKRERRRRKNLWLRSYVHTLMLRMVYNGMIAYLLITV